MDEPEVQIIIPVYNAGEKLRKCLDSVKSQSFTRWQALVVDDASTDGSLDVIKKYAREDDRFECVSLKINSGASAARNAALDRLSAEYAAFLDADDYWERDMLETLVAKARDGNWDVVQCRYIYDYPGGKTAVPRGAFPADAELRGPELKRVYIKMMTGINMNHVCIKLIKRAVIGELRFDTKLKTAEDLKFSVGFFKNVKSYCFVDKVLYHYVRSGASLTGGGLRFREKLRANRRVSREIVGALPCWQMDTAFYRTLSYMRPYVIIVSKVFRMLREKLFSRK